MAQDQVDNSEEYYTEEVAKSEEQISYENTVAKSIDTLADVIQSIAESQQGVEKAITEIHDRVKALETPSDLPLSPKGTQGGDDVGAKVTAPNDPYPVGEQVGLDSDRKNKNPPKKDPSGLKMQEKPVNKAEEEVSEPEMVTKSEHEFVTETPRPGANLETVDKSLSKDYSPILKDARSNGFDGLSNVARDILNGKYYKPTAEEVGF
jgi:uncharacterized protein (UPF0335 family)